MAKNLMWCGYLDAGNKSSPVVIDQRLETGNPDTIYLFNLERNEILQYNRSIVEPKLRELRDDEASILGDLKAAYSKARRTFKVHSERVIPAAGRRQKNSQDKSSQDKKEADSDDVYSLTGAEIEPAADEDWAEEEND